MHNSNNASITSDVAINVFGFKLRIKLMILYPLVCMYLRLFNDSSTLVRKRYKKSHICVVVVADCRIGNKMLGPPKAAIQLASEAGRATFQPLTNRATGNRVMMAPACALKIVTAWILGGGEVAGPVVKVRVRSGMGQGWDRIRRCCIDHKWERYSGTCNNLGGGIDMRVG